MVVNYINTKNIEIEKRNEKGIGYRMLTNPFLWVKLLNAIQCL